MSFKASKLVWFKQTKCGDFRYSLLERLVSHTPVHEGAEMYCVHRLTCMNDYDNCSVVCKKVAK